MEEDQELEIPRSHTAVRENNDFMDKLALMRAEKHWSEKDQKDWLEARGYRPETINRFCRGVNLRLFNLNHTEKKPRGKKKPVTQASDPTEGTQGGEQ